MANTVFNNKVIANKATDLLTTAINTKNYMTVDNQLTQSAGMVKTVNVYTYTGVAEELAAGVGNTAATRGSIAYTGTDYTVKTVQQAYDYLDEDALKDPFIVDAMLKGSVQVMANKITSDFVGQLGLNTITNEIELSGDLSYDDIVDGISKLNLEDEKEIFIMIPNTWKAALRKDSDYISAHQGDVVYTGQVGTICGIPVIATKALTNAAYVMTREAITCFMKKDVESEQDRNPDTRTNSVYLRTYYVVALTDATKVCRLKSAASV